jgi:hypothetical protein
MTAPATIEGQMLPATTKKRTPAKASQNAMGLLQMAVENNASMDTIERLVALQQGMAAREAETQWNAAMNRAQAAMGRVAADATNPQTHSKYATYAALDREVRPIYTQEGLSLSFDTADTTKAEVVKVLCYVAHSAGHSRTYQAEMPADGKGARGNDVMTKTHASGAAMAYGMRYLLKMIFNIAVGEDDDDGNGGPPATRGAGPATAIPATPKVTPWSNEQLSTFEELMDRAYTAFGRAGQPDGFNGYAAKWKACKDGTEPPAAVLEALLASVQKYEAAALAAQNKKLGL